MTYENVVGELLRRIHSFEAVRQSDDSYISQGDDSPYLVFADFSRFLLERLNSQSNADNDAEILRHSFMLLDEMLTSSDPEVVNLAEVAVFEPLADNPDALAIAKCYLSTEANSILDPWLTRWRHWLTYGE